LRRIAVALLLALAGPAAGAPAHLAAQDAPKKPWNLTADFGLVNTAGNTQVTTINVKEGFDWRGERWGLTQTFSLVYAEDRGGTTAELWQAGLRGDRRLGGIWRVYGLFTYMRNPFAGIERRLEETVGVLARPLDTERDSLEFDVGLSVAQQYVPDDRRQDFSSARVAAGYRHTFREKAFVLVKALVLPNLRNSADVRFQGELAVGAPFTDHLALKASYAVIYDNAPDTPELDGRVDRFLTASLQVRF
jgi:putative salt-induced outer membrane protein YdiY